MIPVVSVLMTCYNREHLISESIESVLNSSFRDFELIIVDDCSTDNSLNIINSFSAKDKRIKVFKNENNLGDYPNRNKAASYATGKYLKYVDSDDTISENCLETMVAYMEKYKAAALGVCNIENYKGAEFLSPREALMYHFFTQPLFNLGPLCYIIRADIFKSMNGFKNERMVSDSDLWYRFSVSNPCVVIPEKLAFQRRHENQELADQQNYIIKGAAVKWRYLNNKDCPLSISEIKLIKQQRIKRYLSFTLSSLKKIDIKSAAIYFICLVQTVKLKVNKDG